MRIYTYPRFFPSANIHLSEVFTKLSFGQNKKFKTVQENVAQWLFYVLKNVTLLVKHPLKNVVIYMEGTVFQKLIE